MNYVRPVLVSLLIQATLVSAAEWAQFRGPEGSGISTGGHPPTTWTDKENIKWKLDLAGAGSSSPIIWGDRIFLTTFSGYGDDGGSVDKLQRHLIAIDKATGNIIWDKSVPAELPEDPYSGMLTEHGFASSTPVTDGEHIYVFFGKTGVLGFDWNGKQMWKVNVGHESSNRRWGSAASPVLYKNLVIVNASEESRTVRALDKLTGKEVWKQDADTLELSYSTPALVEANGRTDLVLPVPNELWGLNPETGKLRWYANTSIAGNVSPSVIAHDGVVYVTGGIQRMATMAIRAGGKGDVTASNIVWNSSSYSYVPSPVLSDGNLYVATDQGFALCLDAKDGKVVYKERLPGASSGGRGKPFYASAVLANGNIYAVGRRSGTFVFEAKPEFKLVAHNKALDDTDFNATPAFAGDAIFLRSNRSLYCIASMRTASAENTTKR
jgi:outer membrane protein assembly factor BamB